MNLARETKDHKNIIVGKYNQKKNVVIMYQTFLQRQNNKSLKKMDTDETLAKIEKTKKQMILLKDKWPEYFI